MQVMRIFMVIRYVHLEKVSMVSLPRKIIKVRMNELNKSPNNHLTPFF